MESVNVKAYPSSDIVVRLFHWVNFTSVLILIFLGMFMLFKKELGITGLEAKIALKELHVIVGYVLAINLLIRIIWGFIGSRFARFSAILPGKGFGNKVRAYLASESEGKPQEFIGHNPMGRLAISFILLLLIVITLTGLIRAGTDIFYPPFGSMVTEYIAQADVDPNSLKPYDPTGVDEAKAKEVASFKGIFGKTHIYAAYVLIFMIVLHIVFVVKTEIRDGGNLISSMFTGKKFLKNSPVDLEED